MPIKHDLKADVAAASTWDEAPKYVQHTLKNGLYIFCTKIDRLLEEDAGNAEWLAQGDKDLLRVLNRVVRLHRKGKNWQHLETEYKTVLNDLFINC